MEGATGGSIRRVGRIALQHNALGSLAGMGDRRDQSLRIGMGGIVQNIVRRAFLDDAAQIHDRDAVADLAHSAKVMADEQHAHAQTLLQVDEQVHHLGLDRDVERADGLVADQKIGLGHQGAGDHGALALPARQGVRMPAGMMGLQAHFGHDSSDALVLLGLGADAVDFQRLADLHADRQAPVESAQRILEHHLHALAQGSPGRTA